MKYIYMVVGAVVGGLLGWLLSFWFGLMTGGLVSFILDTSGDGGWVVSMGAFMVGMWAAILIGPIWFGRLGYRLGKRLHEADSDRTNPRLRRSKE